MQIGDHVKGTMSDSLKQSYGIGFESHTNRAITDAWDKAQERVSLNCFLHVIRRALTEVCSGCYC